MAFLEGPENRQMRCAAVVALWLLVAFLAVQVVSGLEGLRYIGTGVAAANTIEVTGHGQVLAVPNIATFTFSVVADNATVAGAQAKATAEINTITNYLTGQGISAADIQTTDYSIEPQYEYQQACPMLETSSGAPYPCPSGKQMLTGYEVSQTTTVKVEDTSKAGALLSGVGSNGATQVSGLTFTFADPNAPQDQARAMAIADAKQKAQVLASELGVSLVQVVSFNENTGGIEPLPLYATASGASISSAPAAPTISAGQNTVTDDVTITYEIK